MRATSAALLLLLAVAAAGPARGQELEVGPDDDRPDPTLIMDRSTSIWQLYLKGGIVMHPILIASIVALAFGIERAVALRLPVQVPGGLVEEAMGRMSRGGPAAAAALVRGRPDALARMLDAALSKIAEGRAAMDEAAAAASYNVLHDLRKNTRPLGIVSNIAPLLGLLGTVTGMINAFDRVSAAGLGRGEEFAAGIAEALITTGAGLIVAIPTFLVFHYFRNKSEDLVQKAEVQTSSFLDRVTVASSPPAPQPAAQARSATAPPAPSQRQLAPHAPPPAPQPAAPQPPGGKP